jgi:hypothetical protein
MGCEDRHSLDLTDAELRGLAERDEERRHYARERVSKCLNLDEADAEEVLTIHDDLCLYDPSGNPLRIARKFWELNKRADEVEKRLNETIDLLEQTVKTLKTVSDRLVSHAHLLPGL